MNTETIFLFWQLCILLGSKIKTRFIQFSCLKVISKKQFLNHRANFEQYASRGIDLVRFHTNPIKAKRYEQSKRKNSVVEVKKGVVITIDTCVITDDEMRISLKSFLYNG